MSNQNVGRNAPGIHPKSGTTAGAYLSEDAKQRAFAKMQRADETDMNRQIAGMSILRACGAFLGVVFLIVNSYQATWALMALAGKAGAGDAGSAWSWDLAGLTWDQWAVGLTAFGLILAAQVVAVRLVIADGAMKGLGILLLVGLMAFSVLTSAIHVAFNVQGGVEQSIRSGDEYQLAKARYETAMQSAATARQSYSDYQDSVRGGDPWSLNATHSQGPARPYVEAIETAQNEAQAAQAAFQQVKATGGGSAMAEVIGVVAGWFGMDTATFALAFAIFAVLLMEFARVYLSLLTGRYLAAAMAEMAQKEPSRSVAAPARPEGQGRGKGGTRPMTDEERGLDAYLAGIERDLDRKDGGATLIRGEFDRDRKPRTMAAASCGDAVMRSEPEDRTPANKRQAAYSKKLAKAKKAIERGEVAQGESLSYDKLKTLVGGGNRETLTALRNDLAEARVAHWNGSRLIAGEAA